MPGFRQNAPKTTSPHGWQLGAQGSGPQVPHRGCQQRVDVAWPPSVASHSSATPEALEGPWRGVRSGRASALTAIPGVGEGVQADLRVCTRGVRISVSFASSCAQGGSAGHSGSTMCIGEQGATGVGWGLQPVPPSYRSKPTLPAPSRMCSGLPGLCK